jgi:hypothetical protein
VSALVTGDLIGGEFVVVCSDEHYFAVYVAVCFKVSLVLVSLAYIIVDILLDNKVATNKVFDGESSLLRLLTSVLMHTVVVSKDTS